MAVFPLFIDLSGKKCVVVGGGNVAERKIETLLRFNSRVIVISPETSKRINELDMEGRVSVIKDVYTKEYLDGAFLVIAATSDRVLNDRIHYDCTERNIFVNVADNPEKCTFVFPSVVKRGNLVIGISTSGGYPLLSKKVREEIEQILPQNFQDIVEALEEIREKALEKIDDPERRKEFLKSVLDRLWRFENEEAD
ncbi:MAG: precorrin-2 dehydrogenase/sirohydrochlorin ferrochelatase family protein [Acetivibrionales bacterium]